MVKEFLKMAGVKTQAEFYKKYPSEKAFFKAHPEAKKLAKAAEGGSFVPSYSDTMMPQAMYGMGMAFGGPTFSKHTGYPHQQYVPALDWMRDGGSPLVTTQGQVLRNYNNTAAFTPGGWSGNVMQLPPVTPRYADGGGMPPEQGGGQPQQGGGEDQMQQIVQFIGQALQQGMQPEEIIQKLVEAGLPQDQAQQLVQAVIQQMQGGQGGGQGMPPQGAQEEMMEGPQGQEAPPQEMMEGQAPMGRYGGMYSHGGSAQRPGTYSDGYSGTFSGGQYFAQGGPFIPQYGDIAWNVDYATGGETGSNELLSQVAQLLQQGVQPEAVLQQLVKAKIPQKKAVKIIQMVMQQMQQGAATEQSPMMNYGGPYMPLSNSMNSTNFAAGGPVKKYKKGGEYEMSHDDVQDLINKGYKIQYL